MAQPFTQTPIQSAADAQLVSLKVPPHSIEAEQSVLGGLLLDNGTWDRIGDVVALDVISIRGVPIAWKSVTSRSPPWRIWGAGTR